MEVGDHFHGEIWYAPKLQTKPVACFHCKKAIFYNIVILTWNDVMNPLRYKQNGAKGVDIKP